MNLINHGEIGKKIKDYMASKNAKRIAIAPDEREEELAKLGLMFGNYFAISGYLGDFEKFEVDCLIFYYYDTVAIDKQKKTSYMAIIEDNKPLFLTTYTETGNKETKYTEQSFASYDKESHRIISRVKNNLLIIGQSAELEVSLLDTKDNEYYRKAYKFYYDIDKIVAYQIGDDKFFNINNNRLELAIDRVERVSNKIRSSLDNSLRINQDYINEYKIKRKSIRE